MTIYVNWNERAILTEEQYDEEVDCRADSSFDDGDVFDQFLEVVKGYTLVEAFWAGEDKRTSREIRNEFNDYCVDLAKEELKDEYERVELEDAEND